MKNIKLLSLIPLLALGASTVHQAPALPLPPDIQCGGHTCTAVSLPLTESPHLTITLSTAPGALVHGKGKSPEDVCGHCKQCEGYFDISEDDSSSCDYHIFACNANQDCGGPNDPAPLNLDPPARRSELGSSGATVVDKRHCNQLNPGSELDGVTIYRECGGGDPALTFVGSAAVQCNCD